MDTYNFQCLVIQSTSDTRMLLLLLERVFFLPRKRWNSSQNICWFSFRLNPLYISILHVVQSFWTECCGIQSYIHCNRQYLVKKIYRQKSFTLQTNKKHSTVWHLKSVIQIKLSWRQQKFAFETCFIEWNLLSLFVWYNVA